MIPYSVLNVYQRYWYGQGDPLYAVLSRRGNSTDWVTLDDVSEEEFERLRETTEEIIDKSDDKGEVRTAVSFRKTLEAAEAEPTEPNPRKKKATKRKPATRPVGYRRRRSNPASGADVALTVSKEVEKDLKSIFNGKSGLYEPAPLAPAGVLLIAPGDDIEFGDRIYKGLKKEWKWVSLTNGGAVISEGKEKEANAAIVEATASLMTWALPMVAVTQSRLQEEGKTEEQVLKAMKKFNIRHYTPDGSKMPKAGKTKKLKGPSRMTAKIYGEKPKKSQVRAGDVIWYVEVFDDDGKPIGSEGKKGARVGPILDGAAAHGIINLLWGMAQGEEDVIEANPVQRNRLKSKARRKLARKNESYAGGIWDLLRPGSPQMTEPKGPVSEEQLENLSFESSIMVPASSIEAMQLGYYRGIVRGMNTCKWYPSVTGWLQQRAFRKELDKKLVGAYNNLATSVSEHKATPHPSSRGPRVARF